MLKVSYQHRSITPKKHRGQNFLLDPNISHKIVEAAGLQPDDAVLEIGPGFGALTAIIAATMPHFTAVEVEPELAKFIREKFPQVTVIAGDFLDVNLGEIAAGRKLKVLGNIPYSITTPIIFKLLDHQTHVHSIVLMIQDEVARRLSAVPQTKEYGILAVQLQAFTDVEYLFKVSKHVFKPKPDVDSAVVRLTMTPEKHRITNPLQFKKVVRQSFAMRRKTLENNLRKTFRLDGLDIDFKRRAETFSVAEFVALAQLLEDRLISDDKTIVLKN
ncbi:MAG: ribosomal RNA small subunit methyltransferase A [Rhizobacter sp.]|nr:ribosomal RNA small subunit methyltransferase A [Chlorobiales bacterium]